MALTPARVSRWLVVFFAATVSVFYLAAPGTVDLRYWLDFTSKVVQLGPIDGYKAINSAHPPLYSLIFLAIANLSRRLQLDGGLCLKISGVVAEWSMVFLFWRWKRDFNLSMALLLFNILAVGIAYLDVYYGVFVVLTLVLLEKRLLFAAGASLAVSILIKAQAYIIAPFFLAFLIFPAIESYRQGERPLYSVRRALPALAGFFVVTLLVCAPYGRSFVDSLAAATKGNYFNGEALNLSYLINYYVNRYYPDTLGRPGLEGGVATLFRPVPQLSTPLKILALLVYVPILAIYLKRRPFRLERLLAFSATAFLAYWAFNAGVHENHLFLPVLLLLIASAYDRKFLPIALFWGVFFNFNMFMFFGASGRGPPFHRLLFGIDMALPFCVIGIAGFFATAALCLRSSDDRRASQDRASGLVEALGSPSVSTPQAQDGLHGVSGKRHPG